VRIKNVLPVVKVQDRISPGAGAFVAGREVNENPAGALKKPGGEVLVNSYVASQGAVGGSDRGNLEPDDTAGSRATDF
jgi:hypothetical protein